MKDPLNVRGLRPEEAKRYESFYDAQKESRGEWTPYQYALTCGWICLACCAALLMAKIS